MEPSSFPLECKRSLEDADQVRAKRFPARSPNLTRIPSQGPEEARNSLVLEHYRAAVFELTRQNLLLKRQLADAEARLASEAPAPDTM
jgi:hypothetical protein